MSASGPIICRCDYFGWGVDFEAPPGSSSAERRAIANKLVIDRYGEDPTVGGHLSYVEPGLPFPSYVPVRVWYPAEEDGTPEGWY